MNIALTAAVELTPGEMAPMIFPGRRQLPRGQWPFMETLLYFQHCSRRQLIPRTSYAKRRSSVCTAYSGETLAWLLRWRAECFRNSLTKILAWLR